MCRSYIFFDAIGKNCSNLWDDWMFPKAQESNFVLEIMFGKVVI